MTLLAFLFVLGVLIFVHELGHFLAARRHGVRVLTFSLGFGPKILKVTRGDTEYCVSAIPLGGYVKMAGENPEDPRSGQPDEFLSKTKWQRFQILFAGPAMNIILAVVVLAFVLAQGAEVAVFLDQPPVIGTVVPGSPAAQAGLQRNDRILTVAGREVGTWEDLRIAIGTRRAGRDVGVTLLRDGKPVMATVRPIAEGRYEIGNIGVLPDVNPVIHSVIKEDVAEGAGLKAGDVVLSINGERIVTTMQFREVVARNGERELQLAIRRGGQDLQVRATPKDRGDGAKLGLYIGEATKLFKPGPLEAIRMSVERNIESSGLIFRTLTGLFTGETSVRQLQGCRDRPIVGRVGAGRVHRAPLAHGDAQHQPRHPQLDAGAGAGRWPHPDHGPRGHSPARLQHAGQREDAVGRIRRADDAHGDRHLQRSHSDQLDRASDALA
jgi:regulator of sigma E protease